MPALRLHQLMRHSLKCGNMGGSRPGWSMISGSRRRLLRNGMNALFGGLGIDDRTPVTRPIVAVGAGGLLLFYENRSATRFVKWLRQETECRME